MGLPDCRSVWGVIVGKRNGNLWQSQTRRVWDFFCRALPGTSAAWSHGVPEFAPLSSAEPSLARSSRQSVAGEELSALVALHYRLQVCRVGGWVGLNGFQCPKASWLVAHHDFKMFNILCTTTKTTVNCQFEFTTSNVFFPTIQRRKQVLDTTKTAHSLGLRSWSPGLFFGSMHPTSEFPDVSCAPGEVCVAGVQVPHCPA